MIDQSKRLQILEEALAAQAPATYLRLKCDGELADFLRKREGEMMESFYRAYGDIYYQVLREHPDPQQAAQALEAARGEKFREAVVTWSSFSDSE
jgi:hypothetical protein